MITIYTILILAAIMMQAFFTASETALTSVNRNMLKRLVESGNSHAINLEKILKEKGGYLGTTLVGTNIAVVISSVLATRISVEYFTPVAAPLLATCIMVPVTLIFAEIVPKMIARQFSVEVALRVAGPLGRFFKLFFPVISAVNSVGVFLITLLGGKSAPEDVNITKRDLKKMLALGHETGAMEADEVEMIHRALDFGAKKIQDIMVPLYRVSSVIVSDTVDDLKKLVSLTGFSRIPVYEGNKNDIIGIANIYDILFTLDETERKQKKQQMKDFVRDPVFVNGSDGLDIALTRLRHHKQLMGIVADKEDKVIGIVTIEDILEEIVGEI
ncbi:MAG: hemolysin family protein [Candidatus Omnitrophota bacterium]